MSFTLLLQICRRFLFAASTDSLTGILEIFNSFHERLQFTLEMSIDNSLNFLNVNLIVDKHKITFDTYNKATFSESYLNFHSQHLTCHKRVIFSLFDRIFLLSHSKFHYKNIIYDRNFVEKTTKRILFLLYSPDENPDEN